MDDFDTFWYELEKEKMLGIEPETLKKVIERVLSESNLRLKYTEETEAKDIVAVSVDRLGKESRTFVRVEKETRGIEKDDVEDFFDEMNSHGAINGILVINSYFTKDAKEYASALPVRLIDRKELSDLVYLVEAIKLEKAFVSEIGDAWVMRHFKNKAKLRLTSILLGTKDRLEEIDRRYMPIGCFSLRKIDGKSEAHRHAYIDLSSGDLYYIDEGSLKSTDVLKRILELPPETRQQLLDLVEHGALPKENLNDKSVNILAKQDLVDIYDNRSGGGLDRELMSLISFVIAEIVEPIGISRGSYKDPQASAKRYVKAKTRIPPLDQPYNLEHYIEVAKTREGFDADVVKYKPEELVDFLKRLTRSAFVEFNYVVYMPYYIAKYSGPQGMKYERIVSPKFKDFFPKTSSYNTVYHVIDKFPDFPYLLIACFYILTYMSETRKLLHVLSSSLLFVAFMVLVGIIMKSIFRTQRTTPFYGTNDYGVRVLRYGFPSMHSLTSVGATAFAYFIDPAGPLLAFLMTPIALLYIYSRLRIGAHNRTDVIGGAVLGLVLGIISGMYILGTHLPEMAETGLSLLLVLILIASIIKRIKYMY